MRTVLPPQAWSISGNIYPGMGAQSSLFPRGDLLLDLCRVIQRISVLSVFTFHSKGFHVRVRPRDGPGESLTSLPLLLEAIKAIKMA